MTLTSQQRRALVLCLDRTDGWCVSDLIQLGLAEETEDGPILTNKGIALRLRIIAEMEGVRHE